MAIRLLRSGVWRILQLKFRHCAIDAKLAACRLHHRRHTRLVSEIDPQTLRPFHQHDVFSSAQIRVRHQLFAQAFILRQKVH